MSLRFGFRIQSATINTHDNYQKQLVQQQLKALNLQSTPTDYRMLDGISNLQINVNNHKPLGINQLTSYQRKLAGKEVEQIEKLGFLVLHHNDHQSILLTPNDLQWRFYPSTPKQIPLDGYGIKRFDHVAVAANTPVDHCRLQELLHVLGFKAAQPVSSYFLGNQLHKNQCKVEVYQHKETQGVINLVTNVPGHHSVIDRFMHQKGKPAYAVHHLGLLVDQSQSSKPGTDIKKGNTHVFTNFIERLMSQNKTTHSQPLNVLPVKHGEAQQALQQMFLTPILGDDFGSFIELVKREPQSTGFYQANSDALRQQLEVQG